MKPSCRICLGDEDTHDLVSPCACKGSMKWVHKRCIQTYRLKHTKRSVFKCEICNKPYRLRIDHEAETLCAFEHMKNRIGANVIIYMMMNFLVMPIVEGHQEKTFYDPELTINTWVKFFALVYTTFFIPVHKYALGVIQIGMICLFSQAEHPSYLSFITITNIEIIIYSHTKRPAGVLEQSTRNIKRLLVPY